MPCSPRSTITYNSDNPMKHAACLLATMTTLAAADYAAVTPEFEAEVRREMAEWTIEGVSVAWVDGTTTVYEAAFGEASTDSVFRAGSVSKLFNAIAVMQQVEQGKLDLDAPVEAKWLPVNPFPDEPPVTLRQLLSHRSGLQREVNTGGYFDPLEPSLDATVGSLRGGVLATRPGAMTRYSNIAPSLAGKLVEEAAGASFPEWQARHILGPLGMTRSAWLKKDVPEGKIIPSHLRVADGRGGFARRLSPLFDLGTVPAGNLYTTAGDLARFLALLAADGEAPGGGRVLKPGTLAAMWQPQFAEKGPFGLGFALGEFRGRRTVGHGGAVYGYSTSLTWLPEEKLGVVVLSNEDIANGRTKRLADLALDLMLKVKFQVEPPAPPASFTPSREELNALAGAWESASYWWEIEPAAEGNVLKGNYATQPCRLQPVEPTRYRLNSRLHADAEVIVERDAEGRVVSLAVGDQKFTRVAAAPRVMPAPWKSYLGSYGPEFIPLVVHEKFGHLYATTENMVDYRLTPVNRHVFKLPLGMYVEEYLTFLVGPDGRPWAVDLASMTLGRED